MQVDSMRRAAVSKEDIKDDNPLSFFLLRPCPWPAYLGNTHVSGVGGDVQGSAAHLVGGVNVCAQGQKFLDHISMVVRCGTVQSSAAKQVLVLLKNGEKVSG